MVTCVGAVQPQDKLDHVVVLIYHRAGLVPRKFCKIFQILRHIESLDTCMKH
jgi:hypothetical protein